MTPNICGIDPGKSGALAFLDGESVCVIAMPIIHGDRDEYDMPELVALLEHGKPAHVYLEKLQPLPAKMGGSIANYQRGLGLGLFVGILSTLAIPYTLVSPRAWQKELLAGTPGEDTKQRSIMAAQRLFPLVDLRRTDRCKKPHDGFADALLIAEFGRRSFK